MITLTLFAGLTALLLVGVPIGFGLAIATLAGVAEAGLTPIVVVQKMVAGLDSFPLMAIPFFLLAAELMSSGSLSEVLLRFASLFVGHKRGGLGYTNILTITFFSGISGSAVADAAGPGSLLIRMMRRSGYPPAYAAAVTAAASLVGPIIPPSIIMILYALQDDGVSVPRLFLAGILPGLLISGALIGYNAYASHKRNFRADGVRPGWREAARATWRAIPALILPALIVVGVHSGAFTPTEASVVAVFYGLACGMFVYRTLTPAMLPGILARSAYMTAAVLLIIAASMAFSWLLTFAQAPQALSQWIGSLGLSPIAFLLAVNVFLLIFGIFIEPLPGVLVLAPILAPMAAALGIDPTHFAIVVIVNLNLGMITPPVGSLLAVTGLIARVPMSQLNREIYPILALQLVVLALITLVPAVSLILPDAFGAK
ncbi:TRAP transporter large permease [Xanthobacter tagetidis]|jgi:tripartite ATP-independent transporter DctM subunit|uniref:TRAP transporter large permease protein n=1 Tax=Xanthobacter tagetidis TaxID=60216 RepID=A0A3L6ZXQ3_9HYPH|nr:TRAP transporter large permease [Xanthobacter tagetidis]MBB6310226.1 tripartite ATP-independent transporter DctM subunit [Xanthobacter tagetidis]RLP72813.1 TRAP transporter large permease [Xanthobacter tagetidis]